MLSHEKHEIHFSIINIGKIKLEWSWVMKTENIAGLFDLSVDKKGAVVEAGQTCRTKLVIVPLIKCQIKPNKIFIKVSLQLQPSMYTFLFKKNYADSKQL